MKVPFDDLALQYLEIEDEILDATRRVFRSGRYILSQGKEVANFERAFAAYCGCKFAVGTSSGTEAIHLALLAGGIKAGDEVLVPANTYIATAFAATYAGARPVLVDVDPLTLTISAEKAAERITPRTRAIIPVHLYGHPADMSGILSLAREHNLLVVEDAAQAHGAACEGRPVGSFGQAAAFSFYPTKNLGAMGDAGAVTTNDDGLAAEVRRLRYMGQNVKYVHETVGHQERMDEVQGAILSIKLQRLDTWNAQRREQATLYNSLLQDTPAVTPAELPGNKHVYYVYNIRVPRRDALRAWLAERGIETGIFYPIPIHLQGAYEDLGYRTGDFPETERSVAEGIALPLFPGYSEETIRYVAEQVRAFFLGTRSSSRSVLPQLTEGSHQ